MSGRYSSPEPSPEKNVGCSPPRPHSSEEIPVIVESESPSDVNCLLPQGPGFSIQSHAQESADDEVGETIPKRRKISNEISQPQKVEWEEPKRPATQGPLEVKYSLSDGWAKICKKRQNGKLAGRFDVYLLPPVGRRLRSNTEVLRFVQKHPDLPLDPDYVNIFPPIDDSGRVKDSTALQAFKDSLLELRAGSVPSILSPSGNSPTKSQKKTKQKKSKNDNEVLIAEAPSVSPYKFSLLPSGTRVQPSGDVVHMFTLDLTHLAVPASPTEQEPDSEPEPEAYQEPDPDPAPAVIDRPVSMDLPEKKEKHLERLFQDNPRVPEPSQVRIWAQLLNLTYDDVSEWFCQKLKLHIKQQAAAAVTSMKKVKKIPQDAKISVSSDDVPHVRVDATTEIQLEGTPETWPKMEPQNSQEVVSIDSDEDNAHQSTQEVKEVEPGKKAKDLESIDQEFLDSISGADEF